MKITINQDKMLARLQNLIGVVPTKSTFPVLTNILIEAHADKVKLSATDLEVAAVTEIDAQVAAGGAITVPAKQFYEIIRQLPPMPVEVETAENKVTIRCDKSRFNIIGLPKEDFPKIPDIKKDRSFKLSGGVLQSIIKKTLFAVSNDNSRQALCGACFQLNGDVLKVVTTDGHRLAMLETMITPVATKSELLVSPKGLNVVNRMLSDTDQEITIRYDESYTEYLMKNTTIYARHIEGPYPDYDKVIPQSNSKVLTVSVELFTAAVRRVSILSDTFTHQIRLSLKGDSVELSSQTADIGEAREQLAGRYTSEEMEIGYNASYLIDILKNLESDELNMYLNTQLTAALLRPAAENPDYKLMYLLMPIRLPE